MRFLCAVLTAALWWLAGQKMGWFALGWIALTPLFWALADLDARTRWRWGYLGGWLIYAFVNWWIIPTIPKASPVIGIPSPVGALLGVVAVTLIALIQGFLASLCLWAWNTRGPLAHKAPWCLPIIIAVLWAALDALRYETELAHGWGALAYTQWRDTALLQSAAIVGQHGLTALCVWFAVSLALWIRRGDAILWRAPLIVFVLLHLWGAYRLTVPLSQRPPLRVLMVQTNVPSWRKNSEMTADSPYGQAARLTMEAALPGQFDLIVWPETTTSVWQPPGMARMLRSGEAGSEMRGLDAMCHELQTPILFGATRWVSKHEVYNTATLISPDGGEAFSTKQRLVPFGERASYGEVFPFLKQLAPQPEVTPGIPHPLSLQLPRTGQKLVIGGLICFESCFRYPARRLCQNGAQVLVTMSNDEWFSGTNSPWEHAAMTTVRAVENKVTVVQVTNGGYSFVVDPYGRFVVNSDNAFHTTQVTRRDPASDTQQHTGPQGLSTFGVAQALPVTVPLP